MQRLRKEATQEVCLAGYLTLLQHCYRAGDAQAAQQFLKEAHEAAILTALLAAAFAADFTFGMFAMGWAAVILGAWILFDGLHSDPLLLVDTAHTFLSMYTYGGSSGLDRERVMLLHASYHITLVTLAG